MKNTVASIAIILGLFALAVLPLLSWGPPQGKGGMGVGCRDYQIDVDNDSIYLYDGIKRIGAFPLSYDADPLSTLILEDNQ